MKIALICPTNMELMPYLDNYADILKEQDVQFDKIIWNRLGKSYEEENIYLYQGNVEGIQQGIKEYFLFSEFIKKTLKKNDYDKIIIFGIQLSFFLSRFLRKKYNKSYIFDIRDKHKLKYFFNIDKFINNSYATVISSRKYETWLPQHEYILNHNTKENSTTIISGKKTKVGKAHSLNILSYGMLRDLEINKAVINETTGNNIMFSYFGKSDIQNLLKEYAMKNNIKNVNFSGEYHPFEEPDIIKSGDMVNILRYPDSENNKTALPNKLYTAIKFNKPILCFKGTYLSEIVKEYDLGLVLNEIENMEKKISEYFSKLDYIELEKKQEKFLKMIVLENLNFKYEIIKFLEN